MAEDTAETVAEAQPLLSSKPAVLNAFGALCKSVADSVGVSPQAVSSALVIVIIGVVVLAAVPLLRKLGYSGDKFRQAARLMVLIVSYSLCSSMLLILNKVAVTYIPAPSFILFGQLGTSALFVKALASSGLVDAEGIKRDKARKFLVIVLGFVGTLYTNVNALRYVPVDTIICFRASMPLVIAIIEYFYLDRELPSLRSWGALGGVFIGVVVYTLRDIHFTIVGYLWIAAWYTMAVLEMVWVKKVVDTVQMTSWSRTYYQNTLAVPLILAMAVAGQEVAVIRDGSFPAMGVWAFLLSCAAGLGMSYFSFALRAAISATSFSVIGNVCKVLTILVNLLIWENHADASGTAALFFCMVTGSLYRQPPLRKGARPPADPESGMPLLDKPEKAAGKLPTSPPASSYKERPVLT